MQELYSTYGQIIKSGTFWFVLFRLATVKQQINLFSEARQSRVALTWLATAFTSYYILSIQFYNFITLFLFI